jgi:micrococcal nuclease
VVDGDTVMVSRGTKGKRVRLIGIDAPESVDPRRPVGCFGREASQRMFTLLPPGTPVRLVYDVERTDRYGRTLAYVYRRPDGLFVNAALVEEGYAAVATYPPNVVHADEFVALARQAREARLGLWGACQEAPGVP